MSRRTTLTLGVLAAAAALAAGCQATSSAGDAGTGSAQPVSNTRSDAKPSSRQSVVGQALLPRCHTAGLQGTLHGLDAGAGQRYATLTLTNVSGHTCRLYGWPGLALSAVEEGVPTHTVHEGTPHTVTLSAGTSASTRLHWTVVPTGSEPTTGPCETTPVQLVVTPPGESGHLALPWPNGPVCNQGTFSVTPLA